jgi:hypothetical protein
MNRMLIGAAMLAVGLSASAYADSNAPSYQTIMTKAGEAFQAEDWAALNDGLDAAQALRPYSLYVWKMRILARRLNGDVAGALALIEKISERGLVIDLSGHEAFDQLKTEPAYAEIEAQFAANMKSAGAPHMITQYDDANLLPEAYAVGSSGTCFIGSVRTGKIIDLSGAAAPKEIVVANGGVFDIEVRGDTLWAAVNNQLAYKQTDPEDKFASITVFDLTTGAVKREVRVAEPEALLGDLEVAKDGTAYASDSLTPRLFKLAPGGDTLEVFAEDPRFANLQGIALDEPNHRIFIADYLAGLFVVDTDTAEVTKIDNSIDAHLGGIDGLYYYQGALIGIQNGTMPLRIVRIALNDEATAATGFEVLQQNLQDWSEPTHGAIVKTELHYIATSNWPSYDRDWNVREGAELQPVRIMTIPLGAQ